MPPTAFFTIFSPNLPILLVEFIPRQSQFGLNFILLAAALSVLLIPKNKKRSFWQKAARWLRRILKRTNDDYQFYERLIYGAILFILLLVLLAVSNLSILAYLLIIGGLFVVVLTMAISSVLKSAKKRDERLKRKEEAAAEAKRREVEKKEAEDFLAINAQRTKVTTLPNGVQYEVLHEGNPNKTRNNETSLSFSYGKTPYHSYYWKCTFSEVINPQLHQQLVDKMPQNIGAKCRFYIPPADAEKYYQKNETYKLGYKTEPIYQLFIDVEILEP